MVLLSREVSQVDSSQLPCPLSTPSKSPAVTLCPGTIPRGLWDVLEYLSPSQCRKQWEFSKDRTQQQEARGAAHLQHVQLWGKIKRVKCLESSWLSKQRESSPGGSCGWVTLPTPSQQLCPMGVVQEGWTEQGGLQCGLNTPGMSSHGH